MVVLPPPVVPVAPVPVVSVDILFIFELFILFIELVSEDMGDPIVAVSVVIGVDVPVDMESVEVDVPSELSLQAANEPAITKIVKNFFMIVVLLY